MDENDFKRLLEANGVETHAWFEGKLDASLAEMRRHFDMTAERLEKRFDLLGESVAQLDEKIDRQNRGLLPLLAVLLLQ